MTTRTRPYLLAAPLALLLLASGCGNATSGGPEVPAPHGEWTKQELRGTPGVDFPTILYSGDQGVLVAMLSDDGVLQTHLAEEGTSFTAGEPLETGREYVGLGGVAPLDDGWFALGSGGLEQVDGDGELQFEAVGFRSEDGLVWEEVPVTGFDGPVDINALVEVDGVLVAAGAHRGEADPSMGGFRPSVWVSDDGVSWAEAALPEVKDDGESYVADLAVSDGRLLAVGSTDGHGMLWTSDDAGATWRADQSDVLREAYALSNVVAQGATALISMMPGEGAPLILRSTDRGDSWSPATGQPPAEDIEGYAPLWAGGGRFFTVTSVFVETWREPEVCYADLTLCQQDSAVTLYASEDGDDWSRIDTSGIGSGEEGEVHEAIGLPDGSVLAMRGEGGVTVYTWPAGVDLPTETEPTVPHVDLVQVEEGEQPEVGVRYHAPLYLHCGTDWLYLGDQPWKRTDGGSDVETGAGDEIPADWPVAQQTLFGYATLVAPDRLEYSLEDGEVIATYALVDEQPPGCD